jgi:hypothetical protein
MGGSKRKRGTNFQWKLPPLKTAYAFGVKDEIDMDWSVAEEDLLACAHEAEAGKREMI